MALDSDEETGLPITGVLFADATGRGKFSVSLSESEFGLTVPIGRQMPVHLDRGEVEQLMATCARWLA